MARAPDGKVRPPLLILVGFWGGLTIQFFVVLLLNARTGPPIYAPAQAWLVPGGLALLPFAAFVARHRPDVAGMPPRWAGALFWFTVAYVMVVSGLAYYDQRGFVLLFLASFAWLYVAGWHLLAQDARGVKRRGSLAACSLLIAALLAGAGGLGAL